MYNWIRESISDILVAFVMMFLAVAMTTAVNLVI